MLRQQPSKHEMAMQATEWRRHQFTSAQTALLRLKAIVRQDRELFPVHKWKAVGAAKGMSFDEARRARLHALLGSFHWWNFQPDIFSDIKPRFRYTRVR